MSKIEDNKQQSDSNQIAIKAIEEIVRLRKIKRVVVVDDIIGFEISLPELLGLIKSLSTDKRKAVEERVPSIPISSQPFDVVVESLTQIWKEWESGKKIKVKNQVAQVLGQPKDETTRKDIIVIGIIKDCLPGVEFREVSPAQWIKEKDELIAQPEDQGAVLCLFDQDLSKCDGFTAEGGTSGIGLLKSLIDENHSHIIAGILSHHIGIENEVEEWNNFAYNHGLKFNDFLPLSKQRIHSYPSFAEGLKNVSLNQISEKVKNELAEIMHKASEAAHEQIKSLDVFNFNHIIFRSSMDEGVSEIDTLSRIYDIYVANKAPEILADIENPTKLHTLVALARELNNVEIGKEEVLPSPEIRNKLRHMELFEDPELLNPAHSPIQTGDIFLINGQQFILLTQPCDLMVRKEGEREINHEPHKLIGPLILISDELITLNQYRNEREGFGFLQYIETDSSNGKLILFETAIYIKVSIIDLAVFNTDGRCRIDLSEGIPSPPLQLHQSWIARYFLIIDSLNKLKERIDNSIEYIDNIEEKSIQELIWKGLIPKLSIPGLIKPNTIYSQGVFDFGIQRILRLREPEASSMLRAYLSHKAREAKVHDFAQ